MRVANASDSNIETACVLRLDRKILLLLIVCQALSGTNRLRRCNRTTRQKKLQELLVSQGKRMYDAACVHRRIPCSRSSRKYLLLELPILHHNNQSIRPARRRPCCVRACAICMSRSHESRCLASGSLLERESEAKTRRPRIWVRPRKRLCRAHCRESTHLGRYSKVLGTSKTPICFVIVLNVV